MTARSSFSQVDAARLEGRLETVTQRQKEIQAIHAAVCKNASDLRSTLLGEDPTRTEIDVSVETNISLQLLRSIFDQISLKQQLADERLVQQEKNNEHRHDPLGTVLILSNASMPLSSVLVPLAFAIAGGNTSIVILSPALPTFSKNLHQTLQKSGLDLEATELLIPESQPKLEQIISELSGFSFNGVFAPGETEAKLVASQSFHKSNPQVRLTLGAAADLSTAIVTRKADIKLAASEIVRSNCGYGATPSAAPGFVFVDEFVLENFVEHLQKAIRDTQARLKRFKPIAKTVKIASSMIGFERKGGRIFELGEGKAILVGDADWKSLKHYESVLTMKRTRPEYNNVLCLLPTTSLEGAISLAGHLNSAHGPCAPLYVFSEPSEARYISLFVPSSATYINQIPTVALFAPPPHLPIELTLKTIFSKPHPVFHSLLPVVSIPHHIFDQPGDTIINSLTSMIAGHKLEPPKQKSGYQTGFFAQGVLVGFSHLLGGLAVTSYGMWSLMRFISNRFL